MSSHKFVLANNKNVVVKTAAFQLIAENISYGNSNIHSLLNKTVFYY